MTPTQIMQLYNLQELQPGTILHLSPEGHTVAVTTHRVRFESAAVALVVDKNNLPDDEQAQEADLVVEVYSKPNTYLLYPKLDNDWFLNPNRMTRGVERG